MAEATIVKAVETAIAKSKEKERKFTQSVDLAINLKNIDLSVPKNRIEEDIPLPNGRGSKTVKVALFAGADLAARAKESADLIITPEQINDYAGNKKAFKKLVNDTHYFLAEAPLMPTIGKTLGIVLGPRGKMPRPVPPTADPTNIINSLKTQVRLRSKDKKTFHTIVGTDDMGADKVAENIEVVLKRLEAKLEQGKNNIGSIWVKTTMGPAQKVI